MICATKHKIIAVAITGEACMSVSLSHLHKCTNQLKKKKGALINKIVQKVCK
jgi:hypothetical protein